MQPAHGLGAILFHGDKCSLRGGRESTVALISGGVCRPARREAETSEELLGPLGKQA